MLALINPSGPANPGLMRAAGSEVFFVASDGVHGTELWRTDGTAAGTAMVADITPGQAGSNIA